MNKKEKKSQYDLAYQKQNVKQVSLKLNRITDASLVAYLESQPNIQGYIKRLIQEDIEKHT